MQSGLLTPPFNSWSAALTETCRSFIREVADALPMFSLDLVGVCMQYVSFPPASTGAKARLLFAFGSKGHADGQFRGAVTGLAVSPDNNIWTASDGKVQLFNTDGKFLRHAAKGQWNGDVH